MIDTSNVLLMIFVVFCAVLALLWLLLPFAVFGVKDKLQEIIDELRRRK